MFYSLTFAKDPPSQSIGTAIQYDPATGETVVDGVSFSANTWSDWHLIPSSRPDIVLPSKKTNYVDIPGRDGSLDLTNYLTGKPSISDRSGTWEFIVVREYEGVIVDSRSWIERKNEITEFLDGSVINVFYEEMPGYYYRGRVYVDSNGWRTGANYSTITITYRLKPYKINSSTGEEAGL